MYNWYHTGVYGQVNNNKWSCCNESTREAKGCRKTTKFSQRPRVASLSVQWQRQPRFCAQDGQSTTVLPTIADREELSMSMPVYSSSSKWGDEEAHDQDETNEYVLIYKCTSCMGMVINSYSIFMPEWTTY